MCLKNLWNVVNEQGNSAPLPSYIYGAFSHSVMTRPIHKGADLATGVMGRCAGALVVNKLAADLNSRTESIKDVELGCISTILGTKRDDVTLLLSHRGAIELSNMVFFALAYSASATVPSDVLDAVQQTFSILSQALPTEWNFKLRQDQTDTTISVSEGQCELVLRSCLHELSVLIRDIISHPLYVSDNPLERCKSVQ